jgi:hypothetical protein
MVSAEGRIKIMSWANSKSGSSGPLVTLSYPFLRSLASSSLQECWQRVATEVPNSVPFLLEAIYSGFAYGSWFPHTLQRVQRPVFALYCSCCDWNLPQSAMRVSCRRPFHIITGSSELEHRHHTILESHQMTMLYEPQQGHFQVHNFTYSLAAGRSVLRCNIATYIERSERAWLFLKYADQNVHSKFEFCKLTAISRLDTN